ncbi:MAG TPA: hypothetical protein VFF73_21605 [Planctomycetota bacterium]|nr:hypothetical protein [Planctomycetota bacterium]
MKGALLVFLAALVFVGARALEPPSNPLDEFLPLVAAQRVLSGEVPYRDYTTLYPPLMTLLDAGLLRVMPSSLLAARFLFTVIVAIGLVLVKVIVSRLTGSERAGTLVGLLGAAAHGAPLWGYALVPAAVIVLGALAAALEPGRGRAALAGFLLGLAALARHDAAAWGALPVLFLIGGRSRRDLLVAVLVAALLPLAFLVTMASLGALAPMEEELVSIPVHLYRGIRGLPWPSPLEDPGDAGGWPALASIYAPFIVGGLAFARSLQTRRNEEIACASLPLVFVMTCVVRPDHAHVYAASLASFAALGVLLRGGRKWIGVALALTIPTACRETLATGRVLRKAVHASWAHRPPRQGMFDDGGLDEARTHALEIVARRPSGSRIFVALPRHDRIWLNDVGFYFDAAALPATRHHELYALVATTAPVQSEIVSDLERTRPFFVVVSDVPPKWEPNASATVFPVHVLDEYLGRAYAPCFEEGNYRVLYRLR